VVLAAAAILPLGLRAVNAAIPGAASHATYLPTIETPRPREPFDEAAAAALREAQPEFVVIGDSMAGVRIDPHHLSRVSGRSVAGLFRDGSPVAYWYLQFKNMVVENQLTKVRGVVFFFRDDQLTTQVEVKSPILDRVARDYEPELDRVFAAHRFGRFSDVHRAARAAYQFDLTRVWLEPRILRAPASSPELVDALNTDVFALDKLRPMEAADLPQAQEPFLDFDAHVGRSLLPLIVDRAARAKIRLAFIRVQRRPTPTGPPPQSDALIAYCKRLREYLEARGAYYYDDYGDPYQPYIQYSDGDHLRAGQRLPYTERFAQRHAAFLQ
jgi:hypothetical protein